MIGSQEAKVSPPTKSKGQTFPFFFLLNWSVLVLLKRIERNDRLERRLKVNLFVVVDFV